MEEIIKTALERKWAESAANKPPVLEDAYTELGFDPEKLDQKVIDTIPKPTGWRIAILPYRDYSYPCRDYSYPYRDYSYPYRDDS